MKKMIILLLLPLLLLNSLTACTTTKQTAEEKIQYHLDKAEEYYDQNNYDLLVTEIDQALLLSKAQYERESIEMGYIYLKAALRSPLGDAVDRIERADKIIKSYKDIEGLANLYYAHGRINARKGDFNSSKIAYEEALRYCEMSKTDMSVLKFDINKGIEYINQSLIMLEKINEVELVRFALAYWHLADIYTANEIQDYEKALGYGINSCQVYTKEQELNVQELEEMKSLKEALQRLYEKSLLAKEQDFESWYQENIDKDL